MSLLIKNLNHLNMIELKKILKIIKIFGHKEANCCNKRLTC